MSNNPIEQGFLDVHYAEPVPPEYVINEVVPVGLTVMSGPPKKAYKSLQAILYAAACAQWGVPALPIWMQPVNCTPAPSLLISYEADAGVINYILNHDCQIKTKPGAMYVAHKPFEFQLDDADKANQLLDYMDEKEPALVVLDTFRNTHSGDENDSSNVIRLLHPLVDWGHAHKAGILLVHHVNKPAEGKDPSSFYNMRGSSALPGLADGLLTIEATKVESEIVINATFKRGQSYRRTVHLGVPGYGWGARGYEVLPPSVQAVGREWNAGNQDVGALSLALKLQPAQITSALEDLRRNKEI